MGDDENNTLIHLKDYKPKVNEWGEINIDTQQHPQKLKVLPKVYALLILLLILAMLLPLFS